MIINEHLIDLEMNLATKEDVIRHLSQFMLQEGRINNYDVFVQSVLDREELSTTGIGFGIAIPHGKSDAVNEPTVAFGRVSKGIDWQSLDQEPVEVVFLLAVPEAAASNEHLRILAALSRKLMHDDFKEKLFHATSKNEIEELLTATLVVEA